MHVGLRRLLVGWILVSFVFGILPAPSVLAGEGPSQQEQPAAEKGGAAPRPATSPVLFQRARYSGTAWGFLTPLFFAGTRAIEALLMKDATATERIDHATKWAKNPRFWMAVGADVGVTSLATALMALMPGGAFLKSAVICMAGFSAFDAIYWGPSEFDFKTIAVQSVALTAVEMAVASLGLPLGAFFPFLAAFATCILLDRFDGFDGKEFDAPYKMKIKNALTAIGLLSPRSKDPAPVGSGSDANEAAGAEVAPGGDVRTVTMPTAELEAAYRRIVESVERGDQEAAVAALAEYDRLRAIVKEQKRVPAAASAR